MDEEESERLAASVVRLGVVRYLLRVGRDDVRRAGLFVCDLGVGMGVERRGCG